MRSVWKRFIVLEGLDGSGTTTQGRLLRQNFPKPLFATWEPSPSAAGDLIREILEHRVSVEPETLARLFSADRYEHLYGKDGIREHLDRGEWVVTDRYYFSSLAYQSVDCGYERVAQLNLEFPLPEYLFYLDVSLEECGRRRKGRSRAQTSEPSKPDLFEKDEFLRKAGHNYHRALSEIPAGLVHFRRLSGDSSAEAIHQQIMQALRGETP